MHLQDKTIDHVLQLCAGVAGTDTTTCRNQLFKQLAESITQGIQESLTVRLNTEKEIRASEAFEEKLAKLEGRGKLDEMKAVIAKAEKDLDATDHRQFIVVEGRKREYGSVVDQAFGKIEQIVGKKRKIDQVDKRNVSIKGPIKLVMS